MDGLWYWGCAILAHKVSSSSAATVEACIPLHACVCACYIHLLHRELSLWISPRFREAGKYVATPVSGPYSPHKKTNNRYSTSAGAKAVIATWTELLNSQVCMQVAAHPGSVSPPSTPLADRLANG